MTPCWPQIGRLVSVQNTIDQLPSIARGNKIVVAMNDVFFSQCYRHTRKKGNSSSRKRSRT